MGIGGSGMSGVSFLAEKMGHTVSGCDIEKTTAYSKNISVGHSAGHVKDVDLVVISPAILFQDEKNEEVIAAKKEGKLMTWQEFLGKILLKDKKIICIAGTHGKSTTTAMAGKLLIDNGFDPTVVVGAMVPGWGGNSRFGKGEYAVVEADEFNNNFLNYHPDIAIINNIEFDHPDFFKNEQEVRDAFKKFTGNLVGEKILITEKDSPNKKFNLKVFGEHNQKNANMVYVLGTRLGISEANIIKSLEGFSGIGRRTELIADRGGVKIFDDYAHHPTAIKTTVEGLRSEFPDSRIWVIDEPHGFARTNALLPKYKGVFDAADKVLIGPIFKARDHETFGMTPEKVAKTSGHKDAMGLASFDEIKNILSQGIKQGDVVLVMGAGKSYLWAREIVNLLPVNFSEITTFHIGGKIKKYFGVNNVEEVRGAVAFAKKNNLPVFIIGGGSDILANDKEFNGVVIKYLGKDISYLGDGMVKAEAGAKWDEMVAFAVDRNLQGIECLTGIPGTVGAAPIQNIGAYGQELKNTFVSLTAFDIDKNKFVEFENKDCNFGYRESIFKRPDHWQKFLITDITLKLKENGEPTIVYDSLKNYLIENKITNPTLAKVRQYIKSIRAGKFENPKEAGNAGSFFKNPILPEAAVNKFKEKYPDFPARIQEDGLYKCSAGWFIEMAGWKGKKFKNAAVSPRHALILINPEQKAKAAEVMELSEKIIEDIDKKFGIKLEREVQLINF